METKICTKCNEEKRLEFFYFRNDTKKIRGTCNKCYKGYSSSRLLKSSNNREKFSNGILTCTLCNIGKELTEFHKDITKPTGYLNQCKACRSIYREENKDKISWQRIFKTYNITKEEYNEILLKQNNCCAICKGNPIIKKGDRLFIDHCHSSGKVRGLLCHHCNVAIGSLFDNIDSLKNAILYLEKSNQ